MMVSVNFHFSQVLIPAISYAKTAPAGTGREPDYVWHVPGMMTEG